jgi:hypothetical protein
MNPTNLIIVPPYLVKTNPNKLNSRQSIKIKTIGCSWMKFFILSTLTLLKFFILLSLSQCIQLLLPYRLLLQHIRLSLYDKSTWCLYSPIYIHSYILIITRLNFTNILYDPYIYDISFGLIVAWKLAQSVFYYSFWTFYSRKTLEYIYYLNKICILSSIWM